MASDIAVVLIPADYVPPGESLDRARVLRLVQVSDVEELASAYNSRTCSAQLSMADGSAAAQVVFVAEQSEGAQGWQNINFKTEDEAFGAFVSRFRRAYLEG